MKEFNASTPGGASYTGPANEVVATPNGAAGAAGVRSLVLADLPNSVNPSLKLPAAVTSLVAYGDSITSGAKQAQAAQNWAQMFATAMGLTLTNSAVSGARLYQAGFVPSAYATSPSAAVGSIGLYGTNDMVDFALSGANQVTVMNAVTAMAVWLGLPNSLKQLVTAMTAVGTWGTSADFGLTSMFSHNSGDTMTGSVTGSVIYVAGVISNTTDFGGASKFDVLVDGVSVSGGAGFSLTNAMTNYTTHYPFCLRFTGFSAGAHAVQVKVLAASGYVDLQWIAGNGAGAQTPWVGMGAALPQTTFGANVVTFNTDLSNLCTSLASDGLNIIYVDDYSAMSLAAFPNQFYSDNVHPNNYGQFTVTKSWVNAMYSGLTFPENSGVNGDAFAKICANFGVTPEALAAILSGLIWGMFAQTPQEGSNNQIGFTGVQTSTATAGAATLPANPAGFVLLQFGLNGITFKVPYYNN